MRDTTTAAYYAEMVRTNQGLINGGVTAIALVMLEWGPLAQQSAASAQVTTFETWRTTYTDGTTNQARARNVYTLVQEGGAWRIAADAHPDAPGSLPTLHAPGGSGGPAPLPAALTAVSSSWTVPQVAAASGGGADVTWVGIGGVYSRHLIPAV